MATDVDVPTGVHPATGTGPATSTGPTTSTRPAGDTAPALDPAVLAELVAALPPDGVLTDPSAVSEYRYDWARDPGAGVAEAVVLATTTADVQATLRWAARHQVPVVPRGAGSGVSGGASAVTGGIVLSLAGMRRCAVDVATRTAVVEPGLFNREVKDAAAQHGLWYPPDPSSFKICSIGGNVATNAGGLCCVKYGVTSDYVLGLEVVLADATVVRVGGPRLKDVAGLSLTKLFVGSEGTLGVITEATLRLLPAPPPAATVIAGFDAMGTACAAVAEIVGRLRPSMLELMDSAAVNAVEDMLGLGLDRSVGALLIAQSDAPGPARADEVAFMAAACATAHRAAGGSPVHSVVTTTDPDEGESFALARRAAFPALQRKGTLMLEDVGVPIPRLARLIAGIEAIAVANDVLIATVAHAGDGNTHPLVVYDAADADAGRRAERAFGQVMDLALSLGWTITGEHGVGRLKKAWLPAYLGADALALTQRIKHALDPIGILNPGAML